MCKRRITAFLIGLPIWLFFSGFFETTSGLNQKGNKAFDGKRYNSALEAYQKAQIRKPDDPTIRYNLGTTFYQLDQFKEAEAQLEQTLTNVKSKELKGTALYNYGNTQYRLGQFDRATEAYRKALDLNPNDKDAKYNLELLQKKKSIFEIQQKKRDQERKENPPPSKQEQQQAGKGKQQEKDQAPQGQGSQQGQQQERNREENKEETEQSQKEQQDEADQNQSGDPKESESESKEQEKGEEKREQPMTPAESENQEGSRPQEGHDPGLKPLFQGQMSQESALRILDALRNSEQELQSLRRPRSETDHEPLKDW